MTDPVFDHPQVAALIDLALAEDVGEGDRTSLATVPAGARARGRLLAKQRLVVCGVPLLGRVLDAMEDFCRLFGKDLFLVEPLFYHSALLYERHGCDYLLGRELMETVDREFAPGGRLHLALDGSTAFREAGFDRTIRGRSWAIHDGVLAALDGAAWGGVKMYRRVGHPAKVSTFPAAVY